jgi:hypothetical protein
MVIGNNLAKFAWSVEHVLWGPRFFKELGNMWYIAWCKTPVNASRLYCVFCRKENPEIRT